MDVTKLQRANQWHKGSKMGMWYDGTKNRNRGNGVIRCDNVQMAKRAQNRDQWQKERSGLTEVDKRRVNGFRELIINTLILLARHAL